MMVNKKKKKFNEGHGELLDLIITFNIGDIWKNK